MVLMRGLRAAGRSTSAIVRQASSKLGGIYTHRAVSFFVEITKYLERNLERLKPIDLNFLNREIAILNNLDPYTKIRIGLSSVRNIFNSKCLFGSHGAMEVYYTWEFQSEKGSPK